MDHVPLPASADLVDTRIDDRYRLKREAGRGCFGVVYEAVDERFESPVAVKLLLPGRGASEATFRREAMLARRFRHPNVVEVYDYGVDPEHDFCYVVMEYLRGRSLDEATLGSGRLLTIEELARFIDQITSALDVAHTRNLVHRDLKPSNIMLVEEGHTLRFVILDLGIASQLDSTQTLRNMTMDKAMTPAYASPEQINGKSVGPKSDMYSFATILYELLTGNIPFSGNSFFALAKDITERRPPSLTEQDIRLAGPGGSITLPNEAVAEFESVLFKCLEKKPQDRPESIHAVGQQLVAILQGVGWERASTPALAQSTAPPTAETIPQVVPRKRSHSLRYLLLLAIALAIGLGALAAIPSSTREVWLPVEPGYTGVGEPVNIGNLWYYPELQLAVDGHEPVSFLLIERADPIYMMQNLVDNDLYSQFASNTAVSEQWKVGAMAGSGDLGVTGPQGQLPVVNVTPMEAHAFATWLAGGHGQLPSLEEWLFAAGLKSGEFGPYQGEWSNGDSQLDIAVDRPDQGPAPVGSSQHDVSTFGIRDMAGNVREWTRTLDRGTVEIPSVRPGDYVYYVSKSYQDEAPYHRDEERRRAFHDASDPLTGFRVVLLPRRPDSE